MGVFQKENLENMVVLKEVIQKKVIAMIKRGIQILKTLMRMELILIIGIIQKVKKVREALKVLFQLVLNNQVVL